jgi:hypothetical protein
MKGYDEWKTRLPPDEAPLDADCTCKSGRASRWCPVHGLDPDDERDKQIDRDQERF